MVKIFYIFLQRDKCLLRMLKVQPNEARKFAEVTGSIIPFIMEDHIFNAVQGIKDKMRIHLGMKPFQFKFCQLFIDSGLSADIFYSLPEKPNNKHANQKTDKQSKPPSLPEWWSDYDRDIPYLFRPSIICSR